MPKTFLRKFTFFFWFGFFLVNIPVYIFGIGYIQNALKDSEKEKIGLMLHTLKPVIALNISFNQNEEIYNIFKNILQYEYIDSVDMSFVDGRSMKVHLHNEHTNSEMLKIFEYETEIIDPFENSTVAILKIRYLNTYLEALNDKVFGIFFIMFMVATLVYFIIFVFFILKDIDALQKISKALQEFLDLNKFVPIEVKNNSQEITTIANVVNNVIEQNSRYVNVLETFNTQLESKVDQKVQELKDKEELMIHQSRQAAMGEMLESIAHQWRQPLNVIGLATVKLDFEYKLQTLSQESFDDSLETITSNINYMSNTIDDFRNFILPNHEKAYFEVQKSFAEVQKVLGAQLKNNHISYEIEVESNIQYYGVESELQQAIIIMLNNSIDAIKSQKEKEIEREFKIWVKISQENGDGVIRFSDNGGGIKKENLNSIFTPYFTTKFASQGTGIGLHIVKSIIEERMGGSIVVKNIEEGCCFTITVPLNTNQEESR